MSDQKYRPRIADGLLQDKLDAMGAVLIEGAKWCGKTTTAQQSSNSQVFLSDPAVLRQFTELLEINPGMLLDGAPPMLIDEWQEAPRLWDAVRHEVDRRNEPGQFILTGSSVPSEENLAQIHHTGTGRFAWLRMRPMSLYESGESNGAVSFASLFDGAKQIAARSPNMNIEQIAFLICRGGWPGCLQVKTEKAALTIADEYFSAVVNSDISRVDGVIRAPERVRRLLRSLARHQGAQPSLPTIAEDISANEAETISLPTIADYINALKKIFVLEDALAWNPNMRSKTAIRSSDTKYFVDPSIAASALGLGPGDLVNDLKTMGLLFETMAVRDLRCYADALGGSIYHYRDKNGLECDAVMHLRGGKYGLVEIKLGGATRIDEGAATLKALAAKIDTDKMMVPSFLMVLTAVGEFAYTRKDGVLVVPITCLRP